MTVFGIGYWCVKEFPKMAHNSVFNNSSFTIYAYHGFAVFTLIPIIYILVRNNITWGGVILTYFITISVIVIIGIGLSVVINNNNILKTLLCGR